MKMYMLLKERQMQDLAGSTFFFRLYSNIQIFALFYRYLSYNKIESYYLYLNFKFLAMKFIWF